MLRLLLDRLWPWRGPLFLVAGSAWDFATLSRVDAWLDNVLLVTYLATLSGLLVLERRLGAQRWVPAWIAARTAWVGTGAQFLFGGLFSAYVVYYSRSASFGRSLVFLLVLVGLLLANELAEHHLTTPRVRLPVYGLVVATFLLVFLPVHTHVFVGLGTAGPIALALVLGVGVLAGDGLVDLAKNVATAAGVLVALRVLIALGLVPPVPLALAEAGAFHDVRRRADGYHLAYEAPGWRVWQDHDAVVHWTEGQTVWVFSAVFAPTGMEFDVIHHWERWDAEQGWVTTDRLDFDLTGGRSGGYRGYTNKRNVAPGPWRVLVETGDGTEIGRVRFEVVPGAAAELVQRVY
jgi:hypothetical protein